MTPETDWVGAHLASGNLADMSHGELKRMRVRIRGEREAIHSAAITWGPDADLCRRMNDLEMLEHSLAVAVRRVERSGGVRQMLTAFRRGVPQP